MKNTFLLLVFLVSALTAFAQEPAKDIKKAARLLGSYNLDQKGMADKLLEAIDLADASIKDPGVAADPASWQTYGEIFMAATNKDVLASVANPDAPIAEPTAPAKAYKGFSMAAKQAEKSYQTKDAMTGLADGLQNIYYMGSALYQANDFPNAYEAFKATHDGYALLKENNISTNFDPAEQDKALEYSGYCALQAGMNKEAKDVFDQIVAKGTAGAAIYESLYNMEKESNPARAEKLLTEARQKFPDDTGLLYAEINHYLAKGELTSLVSKLEKALELEPDNISIYVTLGQVYDKLYQDNAATDPGKAEEYFNKALDYYQQAISRDNQSFDATYSIGALWYNKAAAYSSELNTLSGDYSAEGNRKYDAKKLQMDSAFEKALPFFQRAEKINGTDYNTLVALKEIYARQDKLDLVAEYKAKLEKLGN